MSYVDNNLMAGETVIYKANMHWLIFLPGATMLLLSIVSFASDGAVSGEGMILIGTILLLIAIISLTKAFIAKSTTELAVTSKRVIAKFGLIRRNTIELNHNKVESLSVDQSVLGRILGSGTIVINGTGGGKTPIPNIDNPLEFRKQAMQAVDVEA